MLAELVDHVIGVDPDRDWITAALLEARTSGVIDTARFPATSDGYRDAVLWAGRAEHHVEVGVDDRSRHCGGVIVLSHLVGP